MKFRKLICVAALIWLAAIPTALASTTWYVNGVSGSDSNNCMSTTTACKTIGHAISLASSGDSVRVAPATYTENLTISFNLKIIGAGAVTTIVDGGGRNKVVAIPNAGTVVTISGFTIRNGKASRFFAGSGGGINNYGTLTLINSTLSGNIAGSVGGIYGFGTETLQNSIVAYNSPSQGNCDGTITSQGFNLSDDGSCDFDGPGDLNNTDPMLGPLQNNGGSTETQALISGSPAIDAGNPNGCTDGNGHLLKTDQRGKPRPDKEDTGGCDMGAYERQSD
jgi:hypothetical protein